MNKRKRNSTAGTTGAPQHQGQKRSINGTSKQQTTMNTSNTGTGSRNRFELEVIDLSGDDSNSQEENSNVRAEQGSLPKKKKMDGGKAKTKGTLSTKNRSSPLESGKQSEVFHSAHCSNNGDGSSTDKFQTPTAENSNCFKVPERPVVRQVIKSVVASNEPTCSGLAEASNAASNKKIIPVPIKPERQKKIKVLTEKQKKVTDDTRKVRNAVVAAFQEAFEKISTGDSVDAESDFDALMKNITDCVNLWPHVFTTMRSPQVYESEDRSRAWEILEFARCCLFGLTGIIFVSKKTQRMTKIKKTFRIICQFLSNGHPTLLHNLMPQLLSVIRDLSVSCESDPETKLKLFLQTTESINGARDADNTAATTYTAVTISKSNEWAIPHYLDAISIFFPRIFFYNLQYRHLLMEMLNRLQARFPTQCLNTFIHTSLQNLTIPSIGYLVRSV